MFNLCNVYTKADTTVNVKLNDRELEFILTPLISKRNKAELNEKTQFIIINEYVKYKGTAFQESLFNTLAKCYDDVMATLQVKDIYPLPYHIVNPVLDLFDLEDMFNFLKFEFKLQPPRNLAEVFDTQIESDARGSRVQTYLKDDYLQLAALVTIIKVAMLPVFNYAFIKQKEFNPMHKEFMLFHLFKEHPIYKSEPMTKIKGLIEKLIEQTTTEDVEAIRVLEKQIPKSELPFYILGIVMVQKISIASLVEDDENKNIVTKVYNYVNNKLKATGDVSKTIRNKTVLKDVDGLPGDSESYIESHRQLHSHSPADIVEFEWSVSSIEKIVQQLPIKQKNLINYEVLMDAKNFVEIFKTDYINSIQISILGIIFKSIIDPRSLEYLKTEQLSNLLAVGFTYLWGMGQKNLACLLLSITDEAQSEVLTINSTVNKIRLTKELKEELDYFFPYKRIVNDETYVNVAEETIGTLVDRLFEQKWITQTSDKYTSEVLKDGGKLLTPDLKILLAEFIIKNERNIQKLD